MSRLRISTLTDLPNMLRSRLGAIPTFRIPPPPNRSFTTPPSPSLRSPHLSSRFFLPNSAPLPRSPLLAHLRSFSSSSSRGFARSYRPQGNGGRFNDFKRRLDRIPPNYVVYGIIGVNVAVFGLWQYAQTSFQRFRDPTLYYWMSRNFIVSEDNLTSGRIWTLLTGCFSHSNTSHIALNCLGLYFIAPSVVGLIGTASFFSLYLGGGIVSSVVSLGWHRLFSRNRKARGSEGASGAIYATLAYYAAIFPNQQFLLMFILPVPAWAAVGGIFAYDLYGSIFNPSSGTDSPGHIGGILAGLAFAVASKGRVGRGRRW